MTSEKFVELKIVETSKNLESVLKNNAQKLLDFFKSNLEGALSDPLVDQIQKNPKKTLLDSEMFKFEIPSIT